MILCRTTTAISHVLTCRAQRRSVSVCSLAGAAAARAEALARSQLAVDGTGARRRRSAVRVRSGVDRQPRREHLVGRHVCTLKKAQLGGSRRHHKIVFYTLTVVGQEPLDADVHLAEVAL